MLKLSSRQIARLLCLFDEFKQLEDWPQIYLDSVLLIYDILKALGASEEQIRNLLGEEANEYVELAFHIPGTITTAE